jgi:hypothetical protein
MGRARIPGREQLEQLLVRHAGNLQAIALATGRSRMQVYRWLTSHGLRADDFRPK